MCTVLVSYSRAVCTQARDLYTAHIKVMANRVNSITGVTDKDDPTIMACAFSRLLVGKTPKWMFCVGAI